MSVKQIRMRMWEILDVAKNGDRASRVFDVFILTLIFLNVLAVIMGSVESIYVKHKELLYRFEVISVVIFTIEYLFRLWSCISDKKYSSPIKGRLRYIKTPLAIVDLLAILPFYLPFIGLDLRFLRVVRLLRILRITKIGRYYSSLTLIKTVFVKKKEELILSVTIMLFLLIIASCLMYEVEHNAQPGVFSSIPAAMWWAVATLTTVGYGDIYPLTTAGKILGSIISVLGIGMFALPTGILGAGFVEEIQKMKAKGKACPSCGKAIE